jgi:hypothetical protein
LQRSTLTGPDLKAQAATGSRSRLDSGRLEADGAPALTPAPISSFSALDALLTHFANRALYPLLSTIVIRAIQQVPNMYSGMPLSAIKMRNWRKPA